VILSNSSYRFYNQVVPDGCTNAWAFAGAPASLVAVDLQPAVSGPPGPTGTTHPDTPFPLSFHLASAIPGPAPSPGASVREYVLPIWANGVHLYTRTSGLAPEPPVPIPPLRRRSSLPSATCDDDTAGRSPHAEWRIRLSLPVGGDRRWGRPPRHAHGRRRSLTSTRATHLIARTTCPRAIAFFCPILSILQNGEAWYAAPPSVTNTRTGQPGMAEATRRL
jgi:hypothetical protein